MKTKGRRRKPREESLKALIEEEALIQGVASVLDELMEQRKISRSGLAALLGVSQPRVTQVLRGDENLRLRTVARIAYALGVRIKLSAEPLRKRPPIVTETWKHQGGRDWPEPSLKMVGRR